MKKQTEQTLRARLANHRNKLARFYDNGGPAAGGSIDRFTAVYLRPLTDQKTGSPIAWEYAAMNSYPFHPQGFGQHGETRNGPADWPRIPSLGRRNHLGKRIRFADLPPDCQRLVVQDLIS